MITKSDLDNLNYLHQEIDYIQKKIDQYKPAEIVSDSVKGSSTTFPYTQHTIIIEGLEQKEDKMTTFWNQLREFKEKLENEKMRIELEIEKIPISEIRQIIRLHYIERLSYVQIMFEMGYNAPETPRMKLCRYLEGDYIDFE